MIEILTILKNPPTRYIARNSHSIYLTKKKTTIASNFNSCIDRIT